MKLDSQQQRAFAVDVVRRLAEGGFTAYWAGGCVRDQLLGRTPKDYDVATNALPQEVRELFGRRRTHAVGASFGVITVVGPAGAGHVEVATFRRDVAYSDGRHPDAIEFSSPVDDASRRDFTINGLFYDPVAEEVIDLVDGRADLDRGIVRAIGNPRARIAEDKLRMLRGVRFAATFNFLLEDETRAAISDMAHELPVVSAERIAQEMRLLLVLPARSQAVRLLREVRLLDVVLPEVATLAVADQESRTATGNTASPPTAWQSTLCGLDALVDPSFPLALATALTSVESPDAPAQVCRRWKLSNKEEQRVVWLVKHKDSLIGAATQPWPVVQRLLIAPGICDLIALHQALAETRGDVSTDLEFCRAWLARPAEELNPPPLVSGHDLIKHGLAAGAAFQTLLEQIRDAQLVGRISTRDEALALATHLLAEGLPGKTKRP